MDTLYHYCSLETLISILKFKTIRLSDVNKLNDSHETKEIAAFLREAVLDSLEKSIRGDNLIFGMTRECALQFITKVAIDQLMLNNEALQYVFCISEEKDLLSQWRGYGDNGRGVSIGFNIESLEEIIKNNGNLSFGKVSYVDKSNYTASSFEEIVNIIVQQILKAINTNSLERILTNPYGADIFDRWERLDIFQKSVFYKSISFIQEQEHRIVYNPKVWQSDFIEEFDTDEDGVLFPAGVQFRSIGNDLVSYLDLCFKNHCDDFILNDIIIGPNCIADVNDIKFMLKAYGFYDTAEHVNIDSSLSTYRIKS